VIGLIDVIDRGLDNNQLKGTIPSAIGSLGNLQQLYDEISSPPSLSYEEVSLLHITRGPTHDISLTGWLMEL